MSVRLNYLTKYSVTLSVVRRQFFMIFTYKYYSLIKRKIVKKIVLLFYSIISKNYSIIPWKKQVVKWNVQLKELNFCMILFFNWKIIWFKKSFKPDVSTERNHSKLFLVESKNNLKSYKTKNNGENIIEF